MTNKEIAKAFQLLGQLMELHGENPYKIRSYQSAYRTLRSFEQPLTDMPDAEITAIKGVGKAIHGKIRELLDKGSMDTLERYRKQTPEGVQEMLNIKGFGAKKIRTIWRDLRVETIGELLYAVNENRLIELKGFGKKTQDDLKQKLEYYQKSRHQFHYAALEVEAKTVKAALVQLFPNAIIEFTGSFRRLMPTLEQIELLIGIDEPIAATLKQQFNIRSIQEQRIEIWTANELPAILHICPTHRFGNQQLTLTGGNDFLATHFGTITPDCTTETELFEAKNLPYVLPELRDIKLDLEQLPILIEEKDLKGVLHVHTTYSDGLNTLEAMAEHTQSLGYEYLGITDHSKSAFYANGLQVDRLQQQWAAIDQLNATLAPFKIFKGIESDILSDGSLDYDEAVLQQFDFIIASIHSNLKMDKTKATNRLLKAIENPYTTILGHPTGRLLLSRQGYPIDHKKIIDACAANGVAIELNANPYRLDIDWTWIPYCMEKGVLISINPDAHSKAGILDMHYGTLVARKGGLTAAACLNTMSLAKFESFLHQ